uniref:Myosin, light chain 2b, regulatory, cardiac, slow n=1 Tax=Sinocyclocheilus rhinocerous TaxID=307959 RepID=A0A673HRI5_9TELE
FSMFEQTQIQEFKEVQTKRSFDSNCSDNSLSPTFNTTTEVPLSKKLKGADAEETILNAFKVFDPEGKGTLRKDFAFPPDAAGNLDYKNLVYIITHGEEKNQE